MQHHDGSTERSFSCSLSLPAPVEMVFGCIPEVPKWWTEDFSGSSRELGDEFTIDHPGLHFSKQRVVEVAVPSRMVWLVTKSELPWIKTDPHEWTNTRMVFDLKEEGDHTSLRFTHLGLTSEKECYELVSEGWRMIITDWFRYFVTQGEPSPGMEEAAAIRSRLFAEMTD